MLQQHARENMYRRNFWLFLVDSILFNVAIGLISATTVIPDFVRHLTSSEILIGLSGSLFTVGNTLPQLLVARYIVRFRQKKWCFVAPNIPVRFVILIFGLLTASFGASRPWLLLPAFFLCYCVAAVGDGLVGVTWSDLAATCLDHKWRARMLGLTTAIAGAIMFVVAPRIGAILGKTGPGFPMNYAVLFIASGAIFAASIVPGFFFQEPEGHEPPPRLQSFAEYLPELGRVLKNDVPYRAFVVLRALTALFLMSAPFYIGYATVELGLSSDVAVPALLVMQTAGSIAGALAYTWLGPRNNLLYVKLALFGSALLPACAIFARVVGPVALYAGFLAFGLSSSNLITGYLNWVVGYVEARKRPMYIGLANTLTALVYLAAPIIGGTIVQVLGYAPLFATSLVMAIAALFVTVRFLPDPDRR